MGATAACNLESGTISDAQLMSIAPGMISVLRASDNVSDGSCWLHTTKVSSGAADLQSIADRPYVQIGCKEHDSLGGDCQIRAAVYCR